MGALLAGGMIGWVLEADLKKRRRKHPGNIRALFKVYRATERYRHRMLSAAAGPHVA